MTMNDAERGFDCVEFKRHAQAQIYERIKDMTPEQEIEYFHDAADTGPLGEWWRKIVARSTKNRLAHARTVPGIPESASS